GKDAVRPDGRSAMVRISVTPGLARATGTGRLLSAVVRAFRAASGGAWVEAAAEALSFYGVAAEIAANRTRQQGVGSFQTEFLNQLALLTPEVYAERSRVQRLEQ
ncbi:hydroxyethylthiazole kinase, partial [Paenibacillus riograndensis]